MDDDLPVFIRSVKAVAGQFAAVVGHIFPAGIDDLKYHAMNGLVRQAVPRKENQSAARLIIECQALRFAGANLNALRIAVQQIAVRDRCLLHLHVDSGPQSADHETPVFIRPVDTVRRTKNRAVPVSHEKL